jgi:phosphatidylglycerol:prolipoprotein diacylglycerol transferase
MAYLAYPRIDPIALRLGPLAVRWYGLAYVVGIVVAGVLLYRDSRRRNLGLSADDATELMLFFALGLFAGARLGYALFYDPAGFISEPWRVFAVWTGGMSFHGGLIGAIVGGALWARFRKQPFYPFADLIAAAAPIGLGLGRLANFINGELWGRPTSLPWGMIFPAAGPAPRHPSQLYEALLEGVVLFVIMRVLLSRRVPEGVAFWSFVALYGVIRFSVELTRQPDPQLGFLVAGLTMGQLLSLPMALVGAYMVWRRWRPIRPDGVSLG